VRCGSSDNRRRAAISEENHGELYVSPLDLRPKEMVSRSRPYDPLMAKRSIRSCLSMSSSNWRAFHLAMMALVSFSSTAPP